MGYQVTSWFMDQLDLPSSEPKRVFYIGASDYSNYVMRWPTIRREWDQVYAARITIDLQNDNNELSFFKSAPVTITSSCSLKLGFTHPQSGDELITLFSGRIQSVRFKKGKLTLGLQDKIKVFNETQLGTQDAPVTFTNTDYFPSEIAWTIATSYGGLSAIQSDSNPDIDYASYTSWHAVFTADFIYMRAEFQDKKIRSAMRSLAQMTHSAIYVENDKLFFKRFTEVDSGNVTYVSNDHIDDVSLELDDKDLVNRMSVYGSYQVTSRTWGIQTLTIDTVSVNSYGPYDNQIKDENIWYVESRGCTNLGERLIVTEGVPAENYNMETDLFPFARQIGETLIFTDSYFNITSSDNWRLMGYQLSMETGKMTLNVSRNLVLTPFILDDSYYGILGQSYNLLL